MNFINLFYSVDTIEGIECLSSLSASAVMTISCWLTDWLLLYTPRSTTIRGQALHLRSASKRLREYHECYRVLLCIMALILSFLMTTTCIHNIRTAEEIWGMTEKKRVNNIINQIFSALSRSRYTKLVVSKQSKPSHTTHHTTSAEWMCVLAFARSPMLFGQSSGKYNRAKRQLKWSHYHRLSQPKPVKMRVKENSSLFWLNEK